jgi:hypothetical protein
VRRDFVSGIGVTHADYSRNRLWLSLARQGLSDGFECKSEALKSEAFGYG